MGKRHHKTPGYTYKPAPIANPVVPPRPIEDFAWRILCSSCGAKGSDHRAVDGRCPRTNGWGSVYHFPSFKASGTSPEADARIDKALARYWSAKTAYRRMT